jgi:hypothetical protein
MPNWCYNSFSVTGEKDELERFRSAIQKDDEFDLSVLFPIPEELRIRDVFWSDERYKEMTAEEKAELDDLTARYEANIAEYGHRSWYDWAYANWGTKWSPRVTEMGEVEEYGGNASINGNYETAWSPATGLMKKVSEAFPTLVFEVSFDEEAEAYLGCEIFYNGEVFGSSVDLWATRDLPVAVASDLWRSIAETKKRLDETDFSDDNWTDIRIELDDLYSQLRDDCSYEASKALVAKYPDAYGIKVGE